MSLGPVRRILHHDRLEARRRGASRADRQRAADPSRGARCRKCLTSAGGLGGKHRAAGPGHRRDGRARRRAGSNSKAPPPSHDHVVLITDGLSNTGCLNLSKVISRGSRRPRCWPRARNDADLASLTGVGLHVFGVGFQAANPSLSTAEQAWVVNYWQSAVRRARRRLGRLVRGAVRQTDAARTSECHAPCGPGGRLSQDPEALGRVSRSGRPAIRVRLGHAQPGRAVLPRHRAAADQGAGSDDHRGDRTHRRGRQRRLQHGPVATAGRCGPVVPGLPRVHRRPRRRRGRGRPGLLAPVHPAGAPIRRAWPRTGASRSSWEADDGRR